jgi:hypothetical protein
MEDVKVRTRTGAFCAYFFRLRESAQSAIVVDTSTFGSVVTLVSVAIILSFTMMEFLDYRRVGIDTSVVVDRSRGEKLTVHLNVTFPRVPCYCELLHPNPSRRRRRPWYNLTADTTSSHLCAQYCPSI